MSRGANIYIERGRERDHREEREREREREEGGLRKK